MHVDILTLAHSHMLSRMLLVLYFSFLFLTFCNQDLNVFDISPLEWEFATHTHTHTEHMSYAIYRVYNAGDPLRVCVCVCDDVCKAVRGGWARLCIALDR